ncbi:MAG: IPT/TIG domain-containing protein [Vulcanimicrobiota bacterium]
MKALHAMLVLLCAAPLWGQPQLMEIQPSSARAGVPVILKGSGFGDDPSQVHCWFGSAPAEVTKVVNDAVTARVPYDSPKNAPVRLEVAGASTATLPFLCLPSIKLTVGQNPLDQGQTTKGRFQVYHEDKPVPISYKNASPEIVNFPTGNEKTVQTSGGADNCYEFPIEGIQGNRLYTVEFNWGARVAELIEWKLGWNQFNWTSKENPPIAIDHPAPEDVPKEPPIPKEPPKEEVKPCHCEGSRLIVLLGDGKNPTDVASENYAKELVRQSYRDSPHPGVIRRRNHLHVVHYQANGSKVNWNAPREASPTFVRESEVFREGHKPSDQEVKSIGSVKSVVWSSSRETLPHCCCYFDEVLLMFHGPPIRSGLFADLEVNLPKLLQGRPARKVVFWCCQSGREFYPKQKDTPGVYERLLGQLRSRDCPCRCEPSKCQGLDADFKPAPCPRGSDSVTVLAGGSVLIRGQQVPVDVGLTQIPPTVRFSTPDGRLRKITIKSDGEITVENTPGPAAAAPGSDSGTPIFQGSTLISNGIGPVFNHDKTYFDLTKASQIVIGSEPAYNGPKACPAGEGCQKEPFHPDR